MNSAGDRIGVMDRIYANKMQIGSNVRHDTIKGVYEIAGVLPNGGDADVKLKLFHKCVNMEQLSALLREARPAEDEGLMPSVGIQSKSAPTRPPATLDHTGSVLRPLSKRFRPPLQGFRPPLVAIRSPR